MEHKPSKWHEAYQQRNGIRDFFVAVISVGISLGAVIGAFSITSLEGQIEMDDRRILVDFDLNDGHVTIDPKLNENESLLITIPESDGSLEQTARLSEDEKFEPPYVQTLMIDAQTWKNIKYLLTQETIGGWENSTCLVIPESVTTESYELRCAVE